MKSLFHNIRNYLDTHPKIKKAQSFLELALILPVILIMLLAMVEIAFLVSQYLDLLDLTREAARFASVRDPFDNVPGDQTCKPDTDFDYFYDTSCIFSPPMNSDVCDWTTDPFCNGLNSFIQMDPATDDIVVRVFTISGAGGYGVDEVWPHPDTDYPHFKDWNIGYWAWSNNDDEDPDSNPDTLEDNWKYDCQGNEIRTEPYYTSTSVNERLNIDPTSTIMKLNKGFVSVELYYCYHQVLKLPVWTAFVADPLRLHAYTIMALPAGAPTPTPIATP
jgi:hypothetical protein